MQCMHSNFGDVTLQRLNRFICVIEYVLTQNLQSQPQQNEQEYDFNAVLTTVHGIATMNHDDEP